METPKSLGNFDSFIFDLDNTLYNEEDFLFFIYSEIAKYISVNQNIDHRIVYRFLINEFQIQGRENIFQKLNANFNLHVDISVYLSIMRTATPANIKLFNIYYRIFEALVKNQSDIFVLTNGTLQQQKNKVKSIAWQKFDQCIKFYFAAEYASKPDAEAIDKIMRENNLDKNKCLYIGDSQVDLQCALNAEVHFMYNHQFEKLWT